LSARLVFTELAVRALRNIVAIDIEPSPRLNVVSGDNGHGKTSLLEGLYLVATSRSFRAEKFSEIVQQGAEVATVRANIEEAGQRREQRIALSPGRRSVFIDNKKSPRLSAYAVRTPVVVFHPGDLDLVAGSSSCRRVLLDRVALYLEPLSGDDAQRYTRAMRERQRVLEERGLSAPELDAYEELMAQHGARFSAARAHAAERVIKAVCPAFERLAAHDLELEARYEPGGTDDPDLFRKRLSELRRRDQARGAANFGPQRDELALDLEGRSARRHASQGQQRILTLALKLSELDCVRNARGVHPVLLLDDVSSELDPLRTGAVYDFLRATESQVFVTTTRRELFPTPDVAPEERRDFALVGGALA
jgi:DNA replication and repair protein RecF